ncbi:hypothetical protein, partial [Pseudomonas sp. KK4]|uniref:hypothetical protein n=1 Tax=Pseudomonas sp. KK4 TaxID=1855729 RepID=UPI001C48B8C6
IAKAVGVLFCALEKLPDKNASPHPASIANHCDYASRFKRTLLLADNHKVTVLHFLQFSNQEKTLDSSWLLAIICARERQRS